MGNYRTPITQKEKNQTPDMEQARNLKWGFIPTKKWLQLVRFAQRLASLLNSILALQAMASRRGNRKYQRYSAWSSAATGKKKAKWTTLIIIDSQAVKNTCNALLKVKGVLFLQSNQRN